MVIPLRIVTLTSATRVCCVCGSSEGEKRKEAEPFSSHFSYPQSSTIIQEMMRMKSFVGVPPIPILVFLLACLGHLHVICAAPLNGDDFSSAVLFNLPWLQAAKSSCRLFKVFFCENGCVRIAGGICSWRRNVSTSLQVIGCSVHSDMEPIACISL